MNKIKRFLEPIKKAPFLYIRTTLIFLLWWLNWVVHVLFLERLTHYLELWSKTDFNSTLIYYVVFLIIYEILFLWTWRYWRTDTYNQVLIDVQGKYLKDFVELDNNKIEWIWTWKMVALIKWWIDIWWRLLSMIIDNFSQIFVTLAFTFYMLFRVNSMYAVIFIILYILFHLIAWYFNQKVIEIRKNRIEVKNKYTKHFVKILMSKFEILQSNKIDKEIKLLDEYQEKEVYYNKKMSFPLNLVFRIPWLWMDLILLWVFIYFWNQVFDWNIELSVFVWISWMLILMSKAIWRSVEVYKNFTKDFVEVEKLWELYDTTDKISWYKWWKDFNYKFWDIKLENIDFAYNEWTKNVFDKFNLNIKWWKLTALVWNSWSWKSTIVKLISGYIKANSWDIIVDWQKLSEISLKSYYKNIWYLTQEPSVFDWTILDNLTYAIEDKNSPIIPFVKGDENSNKESKDVWQKHLDKIIKLAKCEFIYDFKDWINTQIWERGVKLSWGQKQRLAIAKVFLKDPKIIILDEPTSALDSFSEEKITKAMNNLFFWRTVIVIAHRLQTVRHADNIFVLENWKVAEEWNHQELIKKWWIYNKMLELQSGF